MSEQNNIEKKKRLFLSIFLTLAIHSTTDLPLFLLEPWNSEENVILNSMAPQIIQDTGVIMISVQ